MVGWLCSAVGRGIATLTALLSSCMACVAGPGGRRYGIRRLNSTNRNKVKDVCLQTLASKESCASHVQRVQTGVWQAGAKHASLIRVCLFHFPGGAGNKKVYRSAVRLQGFTKDLTSAETNSIFASPQLPPPPPCLPQRAPHSNDKHETCLSLAFGVSASQSLHSRPIGPKSPRGVRV